MSKFAKDISTGIVGTWYVFKLNFISAGKCLNSLTGRIVANKMGTMLVQIMDIKPSLFCFLVFCFVFLFGEFPFFLSPAIHMQMGRHFTLTEIASPFYFYSDCLFFNILSYSSTLK